MYKKILAPVDGSEISEWGLEHVKAIATGCSVPEVILFKVVEPVPSGGEIANFAGAEWLRNAEQGALDWSQEYLNKLSTELSSQGIFIRTVVAQGSAADEIIDYAKKNDVDLIVIGSHGSSGIVRWALGSVADKVVRHSTAPVLVAVQRASRS
jgi:nucleotide-binding universal stress UspA family protein